MPVKPQGVTITLGGATLLVDTIEASRDVRFYDRPEFDHEKLRNAPFASGRTPLFQSTLDGSPLEIQILCDGASPDPPRPLGPNPFPQQNVHRRIDIVRYRVAGGQTPETAVTGTIIDSLFATFLADRQKIARFEIRLTATGGVLSYEDLLALQSSDPATIAVGSISLSGAGYNDSGLLLVDFTTGGEYAVPGGEIQKSYQAVLEKWSHVSAFA